MQEEAGSEATRAADSTGPTASPSRARALGVRNVRNVTHRAGPEGLGHAGGDGCSAGYYAPDKMG